MPADPREKALLRIADHDIRRYERAQTRAYRRARLGTFVRRALHWVLTATNTIEDCAP